LSSSKHASVTSVQVNLIICLY